MKHSRSGAALILLAATAAAGPSNDEMARCAVIPAPDSRLACYDALAHRPADKIPSAIAKGARGPATTAATGTTAATAPAAGAAPATASVPATAPAAAPAALAAAPAQAPVSAATIAADPKNFGLTPVQQHTADLGPKSIAAHISIVSSDRLGRTLVVLDSGETWSVMDNDGRLSSGDAVTIKRAALGSFLMMTPSNHRYRVRRLK
jgi:hypothetical protein